MGTNNALIRTVKTFKDLKRNAVIAALFLLLQGIFFVWKPDTDPVEIGKFMAVLVILAGAVSVVSFFIAKDKSFMGTVLMVFSLVLIIAGGILFFRADTMAQILRYAVGLVVAASGIAQMIETVKLGKERRWQFIIGMIVGIFLTGLGVTIFVAPVDVSTVMKRALGFVFILGACVQLFSAFRLNNTIRETEKTNNF